ncbi:membrane-bound lytic murein transglycosylase C [Marinomonas polaris DSM 16579]|uniref:Membrane-bound lytic murein transglycosylase C n=1 Tax=Marinomonas polaris DSM 16579 TaxID=1122206 RepID=A0A1M5JQE1_9GAMM|nr:murein transglycosylase domain-containing protein [Marinomonas polaris]SHG42203.1 membrane-bound lytic murein transglycosylase C [Marinomonas polaris DSM 16579]|tara:strand:- start:7115 stop:8299 length:1185 start_codon:yes stop_codon:yes gene_type:complete
MFHNIVRQSAFVSIGLVLLTLSGCESMSLSFDSVDSVKQLSKQIKEADDLDDVKTIAKQAKVTRDLVRADIKAIQALYAELDQKVNKKWGKGNSELPEKKKYVKYTNDYQARTIVDFEKGTVRVETLTTNSPLDTLKQAVTTTLLTTADPTKTDIFSSDAPDTEGVPFLYPQVMDHDGKLVQYRWRAQRYSDYLVTNKLKKSSSNGKTVYAVEFNLVAQHEHLRQEKYSQYVIAAAKRYNLSPALIYGIIETESSFNPYAVSPANAYGLMQVVPATAGRDVYNLVKKKSGEPSKEVLFSPENNIDIGSAYLHILQTRYLVKVSNKVSQEYSMISAYNGGTGNVLKTFDKDRTRAMNKINQTSTSNVYKKLRYDHPRTESQNYLEKVTKAKKKYE